MLKVVWQIFLMLLLPPARKQMGVSKGERELCSQGFPSSENLSGELKAESNTQCTLYQVTPEN